jgi:phosphate-selective porin
VRPAAIVAACLIAATASAHDEGVRPDAAALLRRLEAAEARIKVLEDQVHAQAPSGLREQSAAAAQPTAPPVLVAPAPPEDKRPQGAVDQPPERPMTHQTVSLTFNGLVQAWYAAGTHGFNDTFRIRRTEIYFNGQITNKARWQVMLDPSKTLGLETASTLLDGARPLTSAAVTQSTRLLQNAVITLDYNPRVRVSVGQFKLPLGLEGQQSSGRLDTAERALFASDRGRGGAFADVRDVGLMVRGSGSRLEVQAGVFNGVAESQNETDRNDQKALAGSVVIRPVSGLHLGGSGAWGSGGNDRPHRDRLGAEIQFTRGPLTLRSELMTGRDGTLHRRGAYGHVGYRFSPRVEGVVRFDTWDPDIDTDGTASSVRERDYIAGINVFLSEHNLKLQANYLRKTFHDVLPARDVFLINTQTFW